MKKSDVSGIVFFVAFCLLVIFFPWTVHYKMLVQQDGVTWTGFTTSGLQQFGQVTKAYPYIMGFLKFALLATFGEMLKARMKTGSWRVSLFPLRVLVWGVFGMIMTVAFALFAQGVGGVNGIGGLMNSGLWFTSTNSTEKSLIFAVSTSFWMNMIFAYPMMLAHEWCNMVLARKKLVGGETFLKNIDSHVWGSFIPKTIVFFWIPAHTVTFLLPPDYRVLMGALLSVALGFILTIRAVKKS